MSWATKRKLIYFFSFLLIIIVVVGLPLFFLLYKRPTCSDNRKNQGEQGVDCGGPCVKLCKAEQLTPVINWQQAFMVTPGTYSAVAYIYNPNVYAEAFNVPYTFILRDSRGQMVAERRGTATIPAGKYFAVFESGISAGDKVPTRAEFEFGQEFNWAAIRSDLPDIQSFNPTLANASTSPTIDADIKNSSTINVGRIDVTAIVYDLSGNAFAASKTYLDSLLHGATGHVVFTWPRPFDRPVSRIELIPVVR